QGSEVMKTYLFRQVLAYTFYGFVCFGVLGYLVWIGIEWMRWMVMLFIFMASLFAIAKIDRLGKVPLSVIIAAMVLGLLLSLVLALSKDITSFIRYRETKRKTGSLLRG